MANFTRILAVLALLGSFAGSARSEDQAPKTDPAILATVDAAIAAINSGSAKDAKAVFTAAPSSIVDDFPPFVWSGKDAVEAYTRDLKAILDKYEITAWRFQRHQPRYIAATGDRAWLVVPASFPFMMKGQTQSVSGDWIFVLAKVDGGSMYPRLALRIALCCREISTSRAGKSISSVPCDSSTRSSHSKDRQVRILSKSYGLPPEIS